MNIAVMSTGTELMRGELVDTNSQWLAAELSERGYEVTEMATVGDDAERLRATLARLGKSHDAIVMTGGLGPTTDDLTSTAVAEVLGVPLVRDATSLAHIQTLYAARGRVLSGYGMKQADFPEGATVLPNPNGTAPGFSVLIDRAQSFFLPGVPREMKEMFTNEVAPRLPAPGDVVRALRLKTYGLTESEVNDRLAGLEAEHGVLLGYRASFPEIEVKILSRGADREVVEGRLRAAGDAIRARLGERYVYGEGNVSLAGVVGELLAQQGLKLGLAESCTGGLLSSMFTEVPGSSRYFMGGVCSYDNAVKCGLLGVGADTLGDHGAVSEAVARQMAAGARRAFGADVSISVTGIAGPDGGTLEKPVGLVHWAVATPHTTVAKQHVFWGTRRQVQMRAAYASLATLRELLLERR